MESLDFDQSLSQSPHLGERKCVRDGYAGRAVETGRRTAPGDSGRAGARVPAAKEDVMDAAPGPTNLPSGTVTFLFTDIEGSTQRWEADRAAMQQAVRLHDEVLREAIESHGGAVFKTVGDAFCAAFSRPEDAAAAAVEVQRKILATTFPIAGGMRVRVALHTGTADERGGDYFGPTVNRVARLLAVAHGGQILLSGVTADLVRAKLDAGASLRDLGRHRLKDLAEATVVEQLAAPGLPAEFPLLRSLDAQPNNLPVQLTSFIGREADLQDAKALFQQTRLLTFAGTGGVGKTRLAVQLAADVSDEFPDGVWFVDLAPLTGGVFVSPTVLSTIGVREEAERDTADTLTEHLRGKTALIILDNCEHVVAETAHLTEQLLRNCPKLKIVVTTREPLAIAAETIVRVSTFGETEGVQLFLTRARTVAPSFALTPKNADLVGQICRRLDGIALAIELAAARVKMMSVEELWKRLDDRFRILTGGSRTALARQQTLRGLIDWSYNLLEDSEKVLLRRLAIFAGAFSLDSATAVCAFDPIDEFEALDILTRLIDKSLVQFEPAEARYWLLDSTKAYALEQLGSAGEWDVLQRRRVAHLSSLAKHAYEENLAGRSDHVRSEITRDYADYRSIMQWALVDGNDVRTGAAIASLLYRYWHESSLWREGRFWLEHVLQCDPEEIDLASVALAHLGLGANSFTAGEFALMEERVRESFRIYTELDDAAGIFYARNGLGIATFLQGRYEESYELFQQNLEQSRARDAKPFVAMTLLNMADLLGRWKGDYHGAERLLEESLEIQRDMPDTVAFASITDARSRLAGYAGEYDRAAALAQEAADLFRQVGDETRVLENLIFMVWCSALSGNPAGAAPVFAETLRALRASMTSLAVASFADACAALALLAGEPRTAVMLHAFAGEQQKRMNAPLAVPLQQQADRVLQAARLTLGADDFAQARERGRALSAEAAVDLAGALSTHLLS